MWIKLGNNVINMDDASSFHIAKDDAHSDYMLRVVMKSGDRHDHICHKDVISKVEPDEAMIEFHRGIVESNGYDDEDGNI